VAEYCPLHGTVLVLTLGAHKNTSAVRDLRSSIQSVRAFTREILHKSTSWQTYRTTAATRFSSFHIHETSYKRIGSFDISVAVLIPKDIKSGRHPLHVKWHSGGLISGDALLQDWFSNYLVS